VREGHVSFADHPNADSLDTGESARGSGLTWSVSLGLSAVPLLGAVLCFLATRHGPVISQDSAAYIGAAANLSQGHGITTPFDLSGSTLSPATAFNFHGAIPLVHFPPGYPAILATLHLMGMSIVTGARWLNIMLMGANVLVLELLVRRLTKSDLLLPISAVALLVVGPADFFGIHENLLYIQSYVLSDPLFLFGFLLGILFLDRFLVKPSRSSGRWVLLCAAIVPLIRWVGLSYAVGAAIVILLYSPLDRRVRTGAAVAVAACGVVPAIAWSLVVTDLMHGESVRTFAWHPPQQTVQDLLNLASRWFFPGAFPNETDWSALIILFLVVGVLLFRMRIPPAADAATSYQRIISLIIMAGTYLLVVLITCYFLDATTPIDNRILLPLIPLAYLIVIAVLGSTLAETRFGWAAIAFLCLLAAVPSIGTTVSVVRTGPTFDAKPDPATMQALSAVRQLPPGILIASGIEDLVYTEAGRPSIRVPVRIEPTTDRLNISFRGQVRQLAAILQEHHGVFLWTPEAVDFVKSGATPGALESVSELAIVRQLPDGGAIFRVVKVYGS
jgi:hypothetical protein